MMDRRLPRRAVWCIAGLALMVASSGCTGACGPNSAYREPAAWLASYRFEGDQILLPAPALGCFQDAGPIPVPAEAGPLEVQAMVRGHGPTYVLAGDGTAWAGLRDQPWFAAAYRQVQAWRAAAPSVVRLTLFERLPSATSSSEIRAAPGAFATDAAVLKAYQLSSPVVTPGAPFVVTLHWDDVPGRDYRGLVATVHVTEASSGRDWFRTESDLAPSGLVGGVESRLAQRFTFTPPDDLPQGTYRVIVGLRERSGRPIPLSSADTLEVTDLILGEVVHPPDVARVPGPMAHAVDIHFGDRGRGVDLVGYDAPAGRQPGESITIALLWRASGKLETDSSVFVHIRDSDGTVVAQSDGVPVYGFYPTTRWETGDYIRDEHPVALPIDLARGRYVVAVGLYDPATGDRLPAYDGTGDRLTDDAASLAVLDVR